MKATSLTDGFLCPKHLHSGEQGEDDSTFDSDFVSFHLNEPLEFVRSYIVSVSEVNDRVSSFRR